MMVSFILITFAKILASNIIYSVIKPNFSIYSAV